MPSPKDGRMGRFRGFSSPYVEDKTVLKKCDGQCLFLPYCDSYSANEKSFPQTGKEYIHTYFYGCSLKWLFSTNITRQKGKKE